ncbi:MAG: hypothetical protein IKO68_10295 [Oscillospiraceae bacterium]|nr:hypothetical protein [Oscillospiraceae bacterium]
MRRVYQDLIFDGTDLGDFGALVIGGNVFDGPERVYDAVSVPGRSGDLLIDRGRWANLIREYTVLLRGDVPEKAARLRSFLGTRRGYKRLEDSVHPEEFYSAAFRGGLDSDLGSLSAARYVLTFERKPQRWLKSGERWRVFTSSGVLANPEETEARPLIRVYGNGTVTVGGVACVVASNPGYVDIDCELQDAFMGAVNCNDKLTLPGGEFPVLGPGENAVALGAGISRADIRPRWWRL